MLAAGAKAGFLVEYAIIYATLGTLLRPVRMALAVSATPLYSRAVGKLRSSLPFYESRPKLNRTIALFLMSVLLNVFASGLLAAFGCYIASIITGVSFFPPPVWASGCTFMTHRAARTCRTRQNNVCVRKITGCDVW